MKNREPDGATEAHRQVEILGPDGDSLHRPRPISRLNAIAAKALSAETWPLVKLVLIVLSVSWAGYGQYERWCDKHQSEQQRVSAAIAQGTYYPPKASFIWGGKECRLMNLDVRPIVEATIVWRAYYLEFGSGSGHVGGALQGGHSNPAAAARELKPRETLTATIDEFAARACIDRTNPMLCDHEGKCGLTLVGCEARFAREGDRAVFELSATGYLDDQCKSHAVGEAWDQSKIPYRWKDERVGKALELVDRFETDNRELKETMARLRETPRPVPPTAE